MFLGFDRIYYMEIGGKFVASLDLSLDACLAALRAETLPQTPVIARWDMGARVPGDTITTGDAMSFIVSDRLASVLRPFTGWSPYDVLLIGRAGEVHPGYYGLAVSGRCGPLQNERSVPIQNGRGTVYQGLFFDEGGWDGSDVFLAGGTALVLVAERVKLAIEKARIKDVRLKRADLVQRIWLR